MAENSMLWDQCWHGWLLSGTRCGLKDINKPVSGSARGSHAQLPWYKNVLPGPGGDWSRIWSIGDLKPNLSHSPDRDVCRPVTFYKNIITESWIETVGKTYSTLIHPLEKNSSQWKTHNCYHWTMQFHLTLWSIWASSCSLFGFRNSQFLCFGSVSLFSLPL